MVTKIFCVYHKKAPEVINKFMYQYPDIFVPILSGACNYNSGTSKLFDLFVKDDDGLNVSLMDGKFSEHTAIFWVYEHYKEIGNPDMVGFCHYRRILNVDYNNLDKTMIYLRRSVGPMTEHARRVLLQYGGGKEICDYILDEYFASFPDYRVATEYMLDDIYFYDKSMFIMSRDKFMDYMSYMTTVYSLVYSDYAINQFLRWHRGRPSRAMHDYLYDRAMSTMIEVLSGAYFQNLKLHNVPVSIIQPVEGTFVGY